MRVRHIARGAAIASAVLAACNRSSPPQPGGCAYTQTAGTCELTSTEELPANSDDTTLVMLRLTYEWVGALPPEIHDRRRFVDWDVPRTRLAEAHAHASAHKTLPCRYALSTGSCPPHIELGQGALPPPPEPTASGRAAVCPPDLASPLNPSIAGIGTGTLIGTFPAKAPPWRRTSVSSAAAGTAGHWADQATAVYVKARTEVQVGIDDMIRVCTGAADSTDTLLDTEQQQDPDASRRRTSVWSRSAVLVEWNKPVTHRRLILWIADRCQVSLESHQAPLAPEELVDLAKALDLDGLDAACRRR